MHALFKNIDLYKKFKKSMKELVKLYYINRYNQPLLKLLKYFLINFYHEKSQKLVIVFIVKTVYDVYEFN